MSSNTTDSGIPFKKRKTQATEKDIRHGGHVLSRGAVLALVKDSDGKDTIELAKDQKEIIDSNSLRLLLLQKRNQTNCSVCSSTSNGSNCAILNCEGSVDRATKLLVQTRRRLTSKSKAEKDTFIYARFRETIVEHNSESNLLTHLFQVEGITMCRKLWCFYYDISKEYLEKCSEVSFALYFSLSLSPSLSISPSLSPPLSLYLSLSLSLHPSLYLSLYLLLLSHSPTHAS